MAAAFVQGKSAVAVGPVSVIAPTFNSAVALGELICVQVGWRESGGLTRTIASVVGGTGNTYTSQTAFDVGGTLRMQTWWVINQHNAAHTITVTMSGSVSDRINCYISTASGVAATSPHLDDATGSTSSGSSCNSGDVITDADGAILFSQVMVTVNRTYTQPTGYTGIGSALSRGWAGYREVDPAATYSAIWNWTGGSTGAIAMHNAFRAEPPAPPAAANRILNILASRGINRGLN